MKKLLAMVLAAVMVLSLCSCATAEETVALRVWVGDNADLPWINGVIENFKAAHPEKIYDISVDIQGEGDCSKRVLNDTEAAADVFTFADDQFNSLMNAEALQQVMVDADEIIAANGGALLSEFPFGKKADRRTFPQRNRLIAGMAAGVLVAESDEAGGSIITANFATDCGRAVFALPGRVEQPGSRGCHRLIREGATLATCAADILEDLSGKPVQQMLALENACAETGENLSAEARKILAALRGGEALSPDAVAERTDMPFPLVSANLLLLELDGRVARKADGAYEIVL